MRASVTFQDVVYQDIIEEVVDEKFSAKYERPRNSPELLLEVMHDYEEIRNKFEAAGDNQKVNLEKMMEANDQLKLFFADMGSAYGAIAFLDPTEKADFAEAICDFMDKKAAA